MILMCLLYLIKLIIFRKVILYLGFCKKDSVRKIKTLIYSITTRLTFSIVRSVQFNITLKQKLVISSKEEKAIEIMQFVV